MGLKDKLNRAFAATAAAALVSWVGVSDAEACRVHRDDYVYEPAMAKYVRSADNIVLARAIEAQPVNPDGPSRYYTYRFEVLESLKGNLEGDFYLNGKPPFDPVTLRACEVDEPGGYHTACTIALSNEQIRQSAHRLAERGRDNWERFHYLAGGAWVSGMGAADHFDPDVITVGCSSMASFELNQTFLIFADGSQRQIGDLLGLNHHLIRRDEDAWLEAVRYFISNPSRDYLPARSLQATLQEFGGPTVIEAKVCHHHMNLIARDVLELPDRHPGEWPDIAFPYPYDEQAALTARCEFHDQFLMFGGEVEELKYQAHSFSSLPLFPIRDGVVDFTALGAQWEIAGDRQVGLEEVLAWWNRD